MARILVVDDESLIRVLVADVGESLGHEVLTAASIKEGQDLAQRGVDIVLLDVLLPDGGRLAHVETFSQLPGRPDVIIITGHGNADAAEAALRSGAWEYLVKPLRVRDLSKALTQAVQWRNSRDSQSRSLLRHPRHHREKAPRWPKRWKHCGKPPRATSTYSSPGKPGPARNCSPAPCTPTACGRPARSSP